MTLTFIFTQAPFRTLDIRSTWTPSHAHGEGAGVYRHLHKAPLSPRTSTSGVPVEPILFVAVTKVPFTLNKEF